ncbi:SAM-dependent methyltransferase, partial [Clostridioides difficile]|nr:SAM-dependent methyltransferase [Clostridioides difficile]
MTFEEMKALLTEQILQQKLVTATISQPRMKSNEIKRIKLKPLMLKNQYHIQIEYQYERILKHENILLAHLPSKLDAFFEEYRQAHIDFVDETV